MGMLRTARMVRPDDADEMGGCYRTSTLGWSKFWRVFPALKVQHLIVDTTL